jgi:hypothetical protein
MSEYCILAIQELQSPASRTGLFALGINLANSAPLCTGKKVANHSP